MNKPNYIAMMTLKLCVQDDLLIELTEHFHIGESWPADHVIYASLEKMGMFLMLVLRRHPDYNISNLDLRVIEKHLKPKISDFT